MAKRVKKEQERQALKNAYDIIAQEPEMLELQLTELPVNEQGKHIVICADKIMKRICTDADYIKIDSFAKVTESWPELGITRQVWQELVNLRRLKRFTEIPEKVLQNIADSYAGSKNITALRETLLGDIIDDKPLVVASISTEKALSYTADYELDEEFNAILDECAVIRNNIDTVYWPKLRMFGDAFQYITGEPYSTFKFCLDMYHYNGGWPKESTPPRVWKAIAGFRYVVDTLQKYTVVDVDNWVSRFGMSVKLNPLHPSRMSWNEIDNIDYGKEFGKHTMYRVKDEHLSKYEQFGIKPWHHLIEINDRLFGYIWDTRIVDLVLRNFTIPENERNYDYIDSCQPLLAPNDFIEGELKDYLPNLYGGTIVNK